MSARPNLPPPPPRPAGPPQRVVHEGLGRGALVLLGVACMAGAATFVCVAIKVVRQLIAGGTP